MANGTVAIVTGAAKGLGRALALELAQKGHNLAICDIDEAALQQFAEEVRGAYNSRVFVQSCDVADPKQVLQFRAALLRQDYGTISVLVNNAGIIGGSSFIKDSPVHWERTFSVNWGGTYNFTRAFLPEFMAAPSALVINICSSSGFWASSSFNMPLSAYSTSKFAVKGFTEALILDCRHHAPHIKPVLVLLGRMTTQLSANSASYLGLKSVPQGLPREANGWCSQPETSVQTLVPEKLHQKLESHAHQQTSIVPLAAEQAAREIIKAVDRGEWRIVIGEGAKILDEAVHAAPNRAYEPAFFQALLQLCDKSLQPECS